MSTKRLLRSLQSFDYKKEILSEGLSKVGASEHDGYLILSGILQKADTLNQNGRIYPHHILEREVRNYQKFILENRSSGECDHPESSVISLLNVSHLIIEARMDGDTVYGKIKVLNTPSGKILQTLVADGVKLGISSRGVGSTENRGDYQVVQDDFTLITWDAVSDPSTPNAFILPESYSPRGKELQELAHVNKIVHDENLSKLTAQPSKIYSILDEILCIKH